MRKFVVVEVVKYVVAASSKASAISKIINNANRNDWVFEVTERYVESEVRIEPHD